MSYTLLDARFRQEPTRASIRATSPYGSVEGHQLIGDL